MELPKSTEWVLKGTPIPKYDGMDNDGIHHKQFDVRLRNGGKGKDKSSRPAPGGPESSWSFGYDCTPSASIEDRPDWENQVNRFLVPCKHNPDKHWLRRARGISLGKLFIHHGKTWSARTLYEFYLSNRVLALKRKCGKSSVAKLCAKRVPIASPSVQYILRSCKHIQHVSWLHRHEVLCYGTVLFSRRPGVQPLADMMCQPRDQRTRGGYVFTCVK